MTQKKKIVNKELRDMLKRMSQITQKSSSHINEKGELIQDKYLSPRQFCDLGGDRGAICDDLKEYEKDISKRKMTTALYNDDETYRKRKKSKKCRCK